jgi:hypothetical protein
MSQPNPSAVMKEIISCISVCQEDFLGEVSRMEDETRPNSFVVRDDNGYFYTVTIETTNAFVG